MAEALPATITLAAVAATVTAMSFNEAFTTTFGDLPVAAPNLVVNGDCLQAEECWDGNSGHSISYQSGGNQKSRWFCLCGEGSYLVGVCGEKLSRIYLTKIIAEVQEIYPRVTHIL